MTYRALQVSRGEPADVRFVERDDFEPRDGEVLLAVRYSSVNYKDALALRGDAGVVRIDPLVPGIDVAGTVLASRDPRWEPSAEVVLTGAGLGETRDGGYAARAIVPGDVLVRVPERFGLSRAAAIGTAGFTAAQAVLALEHAGIPDGPVIVSGATGGVGTLAIALLAASGRSVTASTSDPDGGREFLTRLGAEEVIDRRGLQIAGRALQSQQWAGAVDTIGGTTLSSLLAQTRYGGSVAACGLIESGELATTVMPFILRGVSLLGINSVEASPETRAAVWSRLERDLDLDLLDELTVEVPLAGVTEVAARMLTGGSRGRTVVAVPH